MDFLQIALIFLILLLSIFLAITGLQVFFILRDLKKALDKLNEGNLPSYGSRVLQTGENIVEDPPAGRAGIEKPLASASNLAAKLGRLVKRDKPKPKRFYKRTL